MYKLFHDEKSILTTIIIGLMGNNATVKQEFFYVAKQPILDRDQRTYGYELLFRTGLDEDAAIIKDADFATGDVATYGFVKTQEDINQSKRIFINFTESLILEGAPRALPSSVTVIEVLETIASSPEIMEELIKLKQEGYLIAIDDFDNSTETDEALLNIADIIKVDVLDKNQEELVAIYNQIKDKKALKLAEKVESKSTFEFLHKLGFDFFQGFFFARPQNLAGKKIHASQSSKIRVLSVVNDENLDTEKIIKLVNADASITYRLLRLLNSAAFGLSMKIESVRHAVVLLGNSRMRYWLRMVILSDINTQDNPEELLLLALIRAKFLEELARNGHIPDVHPETMSLFGMLSLLDIMLDTPFPDIFKELPLSRSFQEGYINSGSTLGGYLKLIVSLENNDRSQITSYAEKLKIPLDALDPNLKEAHQWLAAIEAELI